MSRFPDHRTDNVGAFAADYFDELHRATATVATDAVQRAADLIAACVGRDDEVFAAGNGGSAAIANHLVCDYGKGMRADTDWRPRVRSLAANPEMMTAIGNDIGYAEIFAHQLESFARPGDLLITVSSSGESENIVRALHWARDNRVGSIGLTGFSGGRAAQICDVNIHVDSDNYGVVEDVHQSVMHLLGQFLRQSRMPDELVGQRRF